jgi:hypothetical protein
MRDKTLVFLVIGFGLLLAVTPALGHHSFPAEFDANKPIKLTGKVTKVEWTNPHAYIYIDVKNEQTGEVTNWAIEMGSPNGLVRLGWTRNLLKVDDVVTVDGALGRYKSNLANGRSVVLSSTGQRLGAASSEGNRR